MTRTILHFTLGPVQGFVAEARRTRDLWAGSFLLSWLSGKAMAALVAAGGQIIFPRVEGDDLFEAIAKGRAAGAPHIGSLPNRFKADVTTVANNPGDICKGAVLEAWQTVEQAVWQQFIQPIAGKGKDTQAIWERQVGNFWEIAWVVGEAPPDGPDGAWLDQRKNWRSHYPAQPYREGGDHCRLMGQLQEISGYLRFGAEKTRQEAFWEALAEQRYWHPGTGERRRLRNLNIRLDERLSAIALIKRLFPLLDDIEKVIGWRPGERAFQVINWPSVSYIAAVPWLESVARLDPGGVARGEFLRCVNGNTKTGVRGETETRCFGFPREDFFELDGHMLHADAIASAKEDIFDEDRGSNARGNIIEGLKALSEVTNKIAASEFYAVLLMDGDRIGALLRDHEAVVKAGLSFFTAAVKSYFLSPNKSNGVLVYAGGDDVLALLPLDTAIGAAEEIRQKYGEAFQRAIDQTGGNGPMADELTMSAAVIFAQYKIPLRGVLRRAHHYLDDIAKDANGRDSLAIAVLKPGGVAADWVSCWQRTTNPVQTLLGIAETLQRDPEFSSSFFYNIRERYGPLFDAREVAEAGSSGRDVPKAFADPRLIEAILSAEWSKGRSDKAGDDAEIAGERETAVRRLMEVGRPLKRDNHGKVDPIAAYDFDGGLVARFLSQQARWHLGEEDDG